jgi:SAM-dependent methyltransferase
VQPVNGDTTDPSIDSRRALSFGARAELHDRVRPTYPPQVLPLLFADLAGYRVVDVGAGTGKLTTVLAAAGLTVEAVEPDPGMRAMLAARLPEIRVHDGRGEALPLPDSSVDAVVYGQAWHWVDEVAGAHEAARVLRPGGVLAMLWNYADDATGWIAELGRLVVSPQSRDVVGPPALHRFGAAQVCGLMWSREQDVAALPDFALSHSAVAVLPTAQQEAVLAAVRRLTTEHPDLRGQDRVTVSMHLECWLYRREGG